MYSIYQVFNTFFSNFDSIISFWVEIDILRFEFKFEQTFRVCNFFFKNCSITLKQRLSKKTCASFCEFFRRIFLKMNDELMWFVKYFLRKMIFFDIIFSFLIIFILRNFKRFVFFKQSFVENLFWCFMTNNRCCLNSKNINLIFDEDKDFVNDLTRSLERSKTISNVLFSDDNTFSLFWNFEILSWRDVEIAKRRSKTKHFVWLSSSSQFQDVLFAIHKMLAMTMKISFSFRVSFVEIFVRVDVIFFEFSNDSWKNLISHFFRQTNISEESLWRFHSQYFVNDKIDWKIRVSVLDVLDQTTISDQISLFCRDFFVCAC
jgi:hypothetical protein